MLFTLRRNAFKAFHIEKKCRTLVEIKLLPNSFKIILGNFIIDVVIHFKIFLNFYLQVLWSQNKAKSVRYWIEYGGCFTTSFRKTSQYNTPFNFIAVSQAFKSRGNRTGISFKCLFTFLFTQIIELKITLQQMISQRLISVHHTLTVKSKKAAIPFSHWE